MKFLSLLILCAAQISFAQENAAPDFYLGDGLSKWGVEVTEGMGAPLQLRLGSRLQTVTSYQNREDATSGEDVSFYDFYGRRVRLQLEAKYKENIKFSMDLRNDNAGRRDSGDGEFQVGVAYIEVGDLFGNEALSFRMFRAKVDVSRTQTISSANLLFLDRPKISEEAAEFVSHGRRASNFQILGNFNDRLLFQLVAGEGPSGEDFSDATGDQVGSGNIYRSDFMMGGKVKLSPFKGWEDKSPSETYFGMGQHFTIGYGMFHVPHIQFEGGSGIEGETTRTLRNIEASVHYRNISLQAEYFQFDGVVEDFSVMTRRGSSDGYYIQGEYVIPAWSYVAPFARYESWDRFKQADEYNLTSVVGGVNWYLKGNKVRVGVVYQSDKLDTNIRGSADDRNHIFENNKEIKLTTMFHF